MFEGSQYVECPAPPGDRLVLVSDGLVEATDPVGEEYGEKRLQGALLATAALSTAEAVRHIIRTTRDHQHDELRDDATGAVSGLAGERRRRPVARRRTTGDVEPTCVSTRGKRSCAQHRRTAGRRPPRGRRSGRRCDTPAEVERWW